MCVYTCLCLKSVISQPPERFSFPCTKQQQTAGQEQGGGQERGGKRAVAYRGRERVQEELKVRGWDEELGLGVVWGLKGRGASLGCVCVLVPGVCVCGGGWVVGCVLGTEESGSFGRVVCRHKHILSLSTPPFPILHSHIYTHFPPPQKKVGTLKVNVAYEEYRPSLLAVLTGKEERKVAREGALALRLTPGVPVR